MPNAKKPAEPRTQFLAGHLALDFLNTRMRLRGELLDLFQRDEDVLAWLKQAGHPVSKMNNMVSRSLLRSARTLRENIRSLIEKRKAGLRGDPSVLNDFLDHAQSHPRLVWKKASSLTLERIRQQSGPEAILAPVAEAAAVLLASHGRL
jgi:predicted RNA-binding Zn ribbon-like protein